MESPVETEALEETGTFSQNDDTEEGTVPVGVGSTDHGPEGQSDLEPEDPTEHSEHIGSWQVQLVAENPDLENVTQVPVSPDLSDTLELVQDPRPQLNNAADDNEEEEEEFVLGPDHELVKRHQAALSVQLNKELDRVKAALKEKLAQDKSDEAEISDASLELHRLHENLARLQYKLDEVHQTKSATVEKHQKALDQLEANKSLFYNTTNQLKNSNAYVSQLQSEIDNLTHNLTFTQEVSKEFHSNTKAIRNATHKAEAEKLQAEEQKRKQDLYVKRLTKELEMLTEQVALYNAETSAQAEQTQAAKEALSEAEMQMASLQMARKQLLQEWNSSLVGMRRREEASAAMQEAAHLLEHQLLSQDREIKGYKKTIIKEQEQNEILTRQLKRVQMDNSTTKSQINQKQGQQEALQAHYSACLRTLQETERTLAELTKETSNLESEVKDQRRQSEKESALRLELEDKIVFAMQQKLTHNKAAKNSQKLSGKLNALKKEKITQLWQLENEIVAAELESSEIGQNLDNLGFTQKALDEELAKMDKQLSDQGAKMSSFMFFIGQKQSIITKLKKKIDQITEATGHEDLSPLQIKVDSLKAQIGELEGNVRRDHHLWIRKQGTLLGQTQELETASKNILQLQTEQTCMQQEKIRIESLIGGERRDEKEIQKNTQILRGDLTKLSTLLNKNKQLNQALELDNTLMQMDFIKKVKEKELESIQLQLKLEKTAEEKERLFNCLIEAERQIMLWEKKIQIVKETYSAVQGVEEQAEIQRMKAEIHRMEVRLTQLMKERERLLRESEATVARRETIVLRRESVLHCSPNKRTTMGELQRKIQTLQRKISATRKQVTECEREVRELQESQATVGSWLSLQNQLLIDLCGNNFALDQDFVSLLATKDRNLSQLVVLQNRAKKLQSVLDSSYKPLSNSASVEAALQSQMERVHTVSTILHRVCQDFPQHQGALHKLTLALAAHSQEREPELEVS